MPLHPRGFLSAIVATQCLNNFEVRGFYRDLGRDSFFDEKPTVDDAIRNLAEFLVRFTTDGNGNRNAFTSPLAAVGAVLSEYGIGHDLKTTLLALKTAYDRGDVTVDALDTAIRSSLPRKG